MECSRLAILFQGPTAWLRSRNRTSYDYSSGFFLLKRKSNKKTSAERDADHESVALLNLEPALTFFEASAPVRCLSELRKIFFTSIASANNLKNVLRLSLPTAGK